MTGLRASISAGPDEDHEVAEVLEPYGFASVPPDGTRGLLLCPDGNTGHPVILNCGAPGQRITGLASGESALFVGGATSARVVCRANGSIEVQPGTGQTVRAGAAAPAPALAVARVTDGVVLNATDIASLNALITAWNTAAAAGPGPLVVPDGPSLATLTGTGTITSGGSGMVST